jgi:hypothetical protein
MEEYCIGSRGSKQSVMLEEENLLEVDIHPTVLVFRNQQHNQQTIKGEKIKLIESSTISNSISLGTILYVDLTTQQCYQHHA